MVVLVAGLRPADADQWRTDDQLVSLGERVETRDDGDLSLLRRGGEWRPLQRWCA
jgi:hypothetical protein